MTLRARIADVRRRIVEGVGLVASIEAASTTDAEYNALMDLCNAACEDDYDGPDMTGDQALAILAKMEPVWLYTVVEAEMFGSRAWLVVREDGAVCGYRHWLYPALEYTAERMEVDERTRHLWED